MELPELEIDEETATARPVVLLVTKKLETADLGLDPTLCSLASRFDLRLVESPSMALAMSRIVRANNGTVALLLSDMLSKGNEVMHFISEFNRDWPEAGIHLFDSMEGRVIFTEPQQTESRKAAIRIESNGREHLDARLVLKMVNRHFPETTGS